MDYVQLKADLLVAHPVTGAFNVNDALAAGEANVANIPNTAIPIQEILKFLLLDEVYDLNDGDDTQDRSLWQRMKEVAALTIPISGTVANPWGATVFGNITEIRLIKTQQLVDLFILSANGNLPVDLTDSNFQGYVAGAQSAGCMSEAQETALLALGKRSWGVVHSYGVLETIDITTARAL